MVYQFGTHRNLVSAKTRVKVQRIARKHVATFYVAGKDSFWFGADDRGTSHNKALRATVFADLREAGLWEELYPGQDEHDVR